jgi:hypothetical protein
MADITPTTAAGLIPTYWETKVQYAANNRRGLTRMILDTGSKWFGPGGTIKWPVIQVWPTAQAYSPTAALTRQIWANQPLGASSITPSWIYTHGIITEDAAQTGVIDMVQAASPGMAESLYQYVDVAIATLFGSANAVVGGAVAWSEGDFLSAISTLLTNGGDKVELGNIYGVYHTSLWDEFMSTGNIVSAAVRGETNSGAKTGMVEMAYGVKVFFTANVQNTPKSNAVFSKEAIWLARKNRPKIELGRNVTGQDTTTPLPGLSTSIACSTGFGTAYLHKSTTPIFSSDLLVEHNTN